MAGLRFLSLTRATDGLTSIRPAPPEYARTAPDMSGEVEYSTQPLASAVTANATPIEVSAAFWRTGAEAMRAFGASSWAFCRFAALFALSAAGFAAPAAAVVAAATPTRNCLLFIFVCAVSLLPIFSPFL